MKLRMVVAAGLMVAMAASGMDGAKAQTEAASFDLATAKRAAADLADTIERNFVSPETARAYAARLRTRLAAGAYDRAPDAKSFAAAVTADLQAVAPDGHLAMRAPGERPRTRAGGAAIPPMERAGWIAPGVAFVRFNVFEGAPETLAAITAFLDRYQGARTLIVDLRAHRGGGQDEMNLLFPRLFATPRTVMVMDTRAGLAEDGPLSAAMVRVAAPGDIVREEHRVTPLSPASPWAKTQVIVLTSARTASAAEHFSTVMKETGRATLIGETTAGAGNYGRGFDLPGGFTAFIPFGHSYYPGTKGWEGTGVTPTVAVPAGEALATALARLGIAPAKAAALSADWSPPAEEMLPRGPRAVAKVP